MRDTNDGLDKEIFIPLTDVDRLRVRIKTRNEPRPTYAISLECIFDEDERWCAVVRADDWHGSPHLDRLHPDGSQTKQWLPDAGVDSRRNNILNMQRASEYLKGNWEQERQRYEKELNDLRQGAEYS